MPLILTDSGFTDVDVAQALQLCSVFPRTPQTGGCGCNDSRGSVCPGACFQALDGSAMPAVTLAKFLTIVMMVHFFFFKCKLDLGDSK